jgi:hypothetical protein
MGVALELSSPQIQCACCRNQSLEIGYIQKMKATSLGVRKLTWSCKQQQLISADEAVSVLLIFLTFLLFYIDSGYNYQLYGCGGTDTGSPRTQSR